MPIVVAFLAAILVACLQNRELSFDKKLEVMAQGVGDKNIITMLLIFLAAGSFCRCCRKKQCGECGIFMLSLIPARFSVAVLFVVACFVSVAMGTSVGTITLLTPIAAAVSQASGFNLAFCVASVMGGAMFRDFAIVSTAFGADLREIKKVGLVGVLSLIFGLLTSWVAGVGVAYAWAILIL